MKDTVLKKDASRRARRVYLIIYTVVLFLAACMIAASTYKRVQFGDSGLDEILFYATSGLTHEQADRFMAVIEGGLFIAIPVFITLTIPLIALYRNEANMTAKVKSPSQSRWAQFTAVRAMPLYLALVMTGSLWFSWNSFAVGEYIQSLTRVNTIFEDHYVDPRQANVTFPEEKRNLVYIYLESMENTVASREAGGQYTTSRIPELEALALDSTNISFSHQASGLGGALPLTGTTWTSAAMAAQSMGVPLKHSLFNTDGPDNREYKQFLPGAYGIGDVLEAEGYNQTFIMGSRAAFGGRNAMLGQHGDYQIIDYNRAQTSGMIPKGYDVWWGYEDNKLFEFARHEMTRLAKENKPFNLQLLTADTHFTDGYLDAQCPTPYAQKYDNVYACSSRQVAEFVQWIQQQPFSDTTTIVLVGDHLGMQAPYYNAIIADNDTFQRTTYNVILNSAVTTERRHNRLFSSFDLYPTTIAALGATIEGERLGLGVNLFSNKQTLVEEYGRYEVLNQELGKRSEYYEQTILRNK